MATIPRNRKARIAELRETLTTCTVYTQDNYFHGKAIDPRWAWEALGKFAFAKLRDNGGGKFTVHVHDNCWYELS